MSREYVERGGEIVPAPPYLAQDTQLYGFVLAADRDCLARNVCDRYLNQPLETPGRFVPATDHVLFAFDTIDRLRAEGADATHGVWREEEFAIWVPLLDTVADRLVWFHPYMLVDVDSALACGREVYGFPKTFGWFHIPSGSSPPTHLSVETLVTPSFGPGARRVRRPLVTVDSVGGPGADQPGERHKLVSLAELAARLMGDLPQLGAGGIFDLAAAALKLDLVGGRVPIVCLKQFRDSADPKRASVQVVSEVECELTRFVDAEVFSGEYTVTIHDADSHAIRRELGLAAGPLRAVLAFWASFDFRIGASQSVVKNKDLISARPARERIAILGGGMAALTTAFELTSQPGWRDRYDITVYQLGWRLGGKGASGRGENGRIEEHGLHVWLGFYDNAFRVIREVYDQLNPTYAAGKARPGDPEIVDGVFSRWDHAFRRSSLVGVHRCLEDGCYRPLIYNFPENQDEPGEVDPPTVRDHIGLLVDWLKGQIGDEPRKIHDDPPDADGLFGWLAETLVAVKANVEAVAANFGALAGHFGLTALDELGKLVNHLAGADEGTVLKSVKGLLDRFASWMERELLRLGQDPEATDQALLIDMAFTIVRGLLLDVVVPKKKLSDLTDNFTSWLERHGARPMTVSLERNHFLRGLYDFVFAFTDGATDDLDKRASFETGCALRTILRMLFTYRGAIFWKMQAGMGDTVFTPLYKLLLQRGVRFEFFHRVTNLGLSADGSAIASIDFDVQARTKGTRYDPLVPVKGLDCWPAAPRWEQLEGDHAGRDFEDFADTSRVGTRTLRHGVPGSDGFDRVVFGIPVGSVPYLCRELLDASQRWRDMVDHLATVRTMALQLWLSPALTQRGEVVNGAAATALAEPMDTWCDMTDLLAREQWTAPNAPGSLVYFCGPLSGPPPAHRAAAAAEAHEAANMVKLAIQERLTPALRDVLPAAFADGAFSPGLVVASYQRANVNPSDRYVLSAANSSRFRIHPANTGFSNLVITGDWVDSGFNAGCIEGAVIAGIRAANAVLGRSSDDRVIGQDLF